MLSSSSWMNTGMFSLEEIVPQGVGKRKFNEVDFDDLDENNQQSENKKHKKQREYEACGLDTRQEELNELGTPDNRSGCFGCVYIGERDSAAIPYEDVMILIDMIRKSIARTDPINLSIHIARKYEQLRCEINSSLMPGEVPLPEWNAATILDHIRNHNTDPEIQTWVRLAELQELAQIALHASVERDPETGQKRINEKQCKMYMELVKAMESLAKSDPSKKVFFSGGAHIDMKVGAQGMIAISGKNIVDYWKSI